MYSAEVGAVLNDEGMVWVCFRIVLLAGVEAER